jgi:hypothetical protein
MDKIEVTAFCGSFISAMEPPVFCLDGDEYQAPETANEE